MGQSDAQSGPYSLVEDGKPLAKQEEPTKPKPPRLRSLKNYSIDQDLYDRIQAAQRRDYPNISTWDFAQWLLSTAFDEYEAAKQRAAHAQAMKDRMVLTPEEAAHQSARLIVSD